MSHFFRIAGSLLVTPFLIALIHTNATGQHVSGGRRKGDSIPKPRYVPPSDSLIRNRLVTLAMEGPQYQALSHQIKYSEYQLSAIKRSWLNLLSVSVNYNNQSFATPVPGQYQYPKYFFGLTIPIGVIFTLPPQVNGARENVEVNRANQEEIARALRADVLSKYLQYKNYGDLILLENTIVVDQQTAFSQIEEKFKGGTATIEQYNLANRNYNDEQVKKLNLQLSQDLVKIAIEKLIGTDLDTVMR